jgi:ribonucleoside-diphosphate reductase alpha chain
MGMTQKQFDIWWDRYALRDKNGEQIERTPADTFARVADAMAETPEETRDFYRILDGFKFVPGGRILASAGAGNETMAYNCFVIPVRADPHRSSGADSRDAIMDTINTMVQIMSRGGGVGINWSTLRPRGSHLSRVNGTSSGAVGWMDVASTAVGEVIQGGSRRGAAMFMLWDWHPDIIEFTDAKRDSSKITNANISVAVSDSFMRAVENDEQWELEFPDTTHSDYNTVWAGDLQEWKERGLPTRVYRTLRARELWNKICEGAWDNGEPGVVFLERYQKMSTAGAIEKIICVNPCGEQGLGAHSVCNLASINLAAYVKERTFTWGDGRTEKYFDDAAFRADVRTSIRFLDNVIDKSHYMDDIPEIRESQMKLRRIGLGAMGLADMFAYLGVRYGSEASISWTELVYSMMKEEALWASTLLAKEKGAAPGWDSSMLDAPYLRDIPEDLHAHIDEFGLRNLFLLTQAPTGTTSMLAGVNSGLEPFFALEYERNDRMGKSTMRVKPYEEWLKENDPLGTDTPPSYFVTADQLSVEEHVAIQAAAQKYIDSSISKTVNAPNSHTVEDVDKLYRLCYDSGLKGISYFRDGCNRGVVLSRPKEEEKEKIESHDTHTASPYMRPEKVFGVTQRKRTKHGHAFVTVNYAEDNGPIEAFVQVGRASSDISEWAEGLGRLISLGLRYGISKEVIAEQLTGVGGYSKMQPSLSTAVGEALRDASMGDVPVEPVRTEVPATAQVLAPSTGFTPEICTQCGSAAFVREEGCMKCQVCGNSKC